MPAAPQRPDTDHLRTQLAERPYIARDNRAELEVRGANAPPPKESDPLQERTFFTNGWCHFPHDPVLAGWVERTLPAARAAVRAPENAEWLRCGGTWFAGVNALPNDASGAVEGGPPVAGRAVDFIHRLAGTRGLAWDPAQVSVVYPGYPRPMASESAAAFRYRRDCDAAHLDGLLRDGPRRRRFLREHHAFILGIPFAAASPDAAPLAVWEGSHEVIRRVFHDHFTDTPPDEWRNVDVTDLYHAARREIFETCPRREVAAQPGEAYLVHRLALHGIAPWGAGAAAAADGRMIVYFRPDLGGPQAWLSGV